MFAERGRAGQQLLEVLDLFIKLVTQMDEIMLHPLNLVALVLAAKITSDRACRMV